MSGENKWQKQLHGFVHPESLIVIGLGNTDRADDGVGIQIVTHLKIHFPEEVFLETEQSVEGLVLDCLEKKSVRSVLFIDAVDFNGKPGQVQIFTADDIEKLTPFMTTHKVPIGFLMGLIQKAGKQPFLLGIQPKSLIWLGDITEEVHKVIDEMTDFLTVLLKNKN
jgi:hydrogenase 3 maturation protease